VLQSDRFRVPMKPGMSNSVIPRSAPSIIA
jgi:hypothetical protein